MLLSLFLHIGLLILFFSLFLSWFDCHLETFEIGFGTSFEKLIRLLVFYLEYGEIFRTSQTFCLPNVSIGKIAKTSLKLNLCIYCIMQVHTIYSFFSIIFGCNILFKKIGVGNSLVVQWLGLSAFTGEGPSSIPGWGTKIPQATWRGPPQKKLEYT